MAQVLSSLTIHSTSTGARLSVASGQAVSGYWPGCQWLVARLSVASGQAVSGQWPGCQWLVARLSVASGQADSG